MERTKNYDLEDGFIENMGDSFLNYENKRSQNNYFYGFEDFGDDAQRRKNYDLEESLSSPKNALREKHPKMPNIFD